MNPKNDFIFQRLFGEEESKESLMSLLNAILGLEGEKRIRDLQVKENKQLTKKMADDKTGRLDIFAESDDQVLYDIEMQLTDQRNMARRSLFYMSKMYIGSVKQGEDYSKLKRTVTINLLDFKLFQDREAFHSTFHLYDDRDKSLLLTDAFEVHFLELPKFERMVKDMSNPLHRWLLYLTENMPEQERQELIERDPDLKKTEELLIRLSGDEETYRLYEAREHSLMERNSLIADGIAKGMEQGIEKGIEKGMEQGIEQGKVDIAKNMLKKGMEPELIAEVTGMSVEQIHAIEEVR
ncbi:Rpn family recombination-promoting nuclease/putative transposase [Paenibacillus sp. TRM 82003]|nr:Rpn family recombination-promoting nuclease/putative transposase [Paenibacillus sp. TRM 82003]